MSNLFYLADTAVILSADAQAAQAYEDIGTGIFLIIISIVAGVFFFNKMKKNNSNMKKK